MHGCIGRKKCIPEPSIRKESGWLLGCNIHPSYGVLPLFIFRDNIFFISFPLQIFLIKFPEDTFVVDHCHWHLVMDTYRNANNSNPPPNNKKSLSGLPDVDIIIN